MPAPVTYSLTWLDDSGKKTTSSFNLESGRSVDDYNEASDEITRLMDALSGCQIVAANLTIPMRIDGGVKASPAQYSERKAKALFQFESDDGYQSSTEIPGFLATKYLPNSDQVDQTDADVLAVIDKIENGWDDSGILPTSVDVDTSQGNQITTFTNAFKHYKSGR